MEEREEKKYPEKGKRKKVVGKRRTVKIQTPPPQKRESYFREGAKKG